MNKQPQLRSFQTEVQQAVKNMILSSDGSPLDDKVLLAHITCGGGKSILPLIVYQELFEANIVDNLAIVCPRDSLAQQCAEGFEDPFFRNLLDHDYSVNQATNIIDPCRGLSGYATTYQAIGVDRSRINLAAFESRRYLLCLDEFHHVREGSLWHRQLKPLFDMAAFVLLMTGTLERGDDQKIAFIDYKEVTDDTI